MKSEALLVFVPRSQKARLAHRVRHRKAQPVEQRSPVSEKSARWFSEGGELRLPASPARTVSKFEFAKGRVTRRFGAPDRIKLRTPILLRFRYNFFAGLCKGQTSALNKRVQGSSPCTSTNQQIEISAGISSAR
jgi:hypothetical protein